jgi:glutathione S-transferase
MKLYGTTTSPFVRRVRVVAAEVGEDVERIDTATDAGMAALREVSPIRKVPVAVIGGRTIFDSRAIVGELTRARGWGPLAAGYDDNVVNAIDAALDSIIQLFYLRRDGVAIDGTPYAVRQLDRAGAIFAWLAGKLSTERLGFAEISLVCALDWMDFRASYPTERAGLADVRAAWRERPSLASTRPHA